MHRDTEPERHNKQPRWNTQRWHQHRWSKWNTASEVCLPSERPESREAPCRRISLRWSHRPVVTMSWPPHLDKTKTHSLTNNGLYNCLGFNGSDAVMKRDLKKLSADKTQEIKNLDADRHLPGSRGSVIDDAVILIAYNINLLFSIADLSALWEGSLLLKFFFPCLMWESRDKASLQP